MSGNYFQRIVPCVITWNDMVAPDRPQKTTRRRKDAIGMPDKKGRNSDRHSYIFNTFCIPTVTMATRTPLNVTLYAQRVSCRTEICQEHEQRKPNVHVLCESITIYNLATIISKHKSCLETNCASGRS
jgi:hypothetical protein